MNILKRPDSNRWLGILIFTDLLATLGSAVLMGSRPEIAWYVLLCLVAYLFFNQWIVLVLDETEKIGKSILKQQNSHADE